MTRFGFDAGTIMLSTLSDRGVHFPVLAHEMIGLLCCANVSIRLQQVRTARIQVKLRPFTTFLKLRLPFSREARTESSMWIRKSDGREERTTLRPQMYMQLQLSHTQVNLIIGDLSSGFA